MKRHFLPIAAAAFAAALSAAPAQTVIRIVASNGDRTATQTAISKLLAPGWSFNGTNGFVNTPAGLSNATGANFGAWSGSYNGNPVIIKVSFSGALAGIAAVAGNTDQRFVPTNGTNDGVVVNPLTTATFEIGKADFGFSTNFQSTSPFNGVFQGVNYAPVIEEVVGVSPLGFYASPGFPASGANITTQLAQLLYSSGSVTLAQFTGDFTNDASKIVYGLGRNTDAGQRFGAHTEIGLGTTKNVLVWFPSVSGRTTASGITYGGTVSSHQLWPVNQQQGTFPVPLGSGGYSSGALLAENLTVTLGPDAYKNKYFDDELGDFTFQYPDATAGYYIGYLTPGDANNRVLGANNVIPPASRGIALKYNGVDLTDANVRSGKYTAWLYNRILKPQSGLTGVKLTFANALRDQIRNVDAPFGGGLFDDASFKVFRSTDGGLVIPK
jgi:hypothetical protein